MNELDLISLNSERTSDEVANRERESSLISFFYFFWQNNSSSWNWIGVFLTKYPFRKQVKWELKLKFQSVDPLHTTKVIQNMNVLSAESLLESRGSFHLQKKLKKAEKDFNFIWKRGWGFEIIIEKIIHRFRSHQIQTVLWAIKTFFEVQFTLRQWSFLSVETEFTLFTSSSSVNIQKSKPSKQKRTQSLKQNSFLVNIKYILHKFLYL